ncbi:hypothetical protein FRC08_018092 [Ceratobasidium sp. 394]|nr:hypothetical protein FRC08_018092 [Ceratobasidium sp. 394]
MTELRSCYKNAGNDDGVSIEHPRFFQRLPTLHSNSSEMSNPNYPSFKRTVPAQAQQTGLPPCPELRDMRNVVLVDEEDRWYPNLDAATEEALSRGHSEGLAGSGGMLPERLDQFGWGPLPAGTAAGMGYSPGAGGQLPPGGPPVAGGYAVARVYPMAGGYSASQAHPAGGYLASGYPHGSYPHGGGHASGGHPQRGGYPRR